VQAVDFRAEQKFRRGTPSHSCLAVSFLKELESRAGRSIASDYPTILKLMTRSPSDRALTFHRTEPQLSRLGRFLYLLQSFRQQFLFP
jgi:hypothetical protein